MAQGQTTRNNMSLRNPEDVPGSLREIKRWADRLPLGATGFSVYSDANQNVANGGAQAKLNFNLTAGTTRKRDFERWKAPGVITTFTVPPGLSGIYVLSAGIYYAANIGDIYLAIAVNNIAVIADSGPQAVVNRRFCTGLAYLEEGDTIYAGVVNLSATNPIVITAYAGDINTPVVPFLSAWRISLL